MIKKLFRISKKPHKTEKQMADKQDQNKKIYEKIYELEQYLMELEKRIDEEVNFYQKTELINLSNIEEVVLRVVGKYLGEFAKEMVKENWDKLLQKRKRI